VVALVILTIVITTVYSASQCLFECELISAKQRRKNVAKNWQ